MLSIADRQISGGDFFLELENVLGIARCYGLRPLDLHKGDLPPSFEKEVDLLGSLVTVVEEIIGTLEIAVFLAKFGEHKGLPDRPDERGVREMLGRKAEQIAEEANFIEVDLRAFNNALRNILVVRL